MPQKQLKPSQKAKKEHLVKVPRGHPLEGKKLPYHINFSQKGHLMVSLDKKNYFYTTRGFSLGGPRDTFELWVTNGHERHHATPEEASIIAKFFPNWRSRGFGKQE